MVEIAWSEMTRAWTPSPARGTHRAVGAWADLPVAGWEPVSVATLPPPVWGGAAGVSFLSGTRRMAPLSARMKKPIARSSRAMPTTMPKGRDRAPRVGQVEGGGQRPRVDPRGWDLVRQPAIKRYLNGLRVDPEPDRAAAWRRAWGWWLPTRALSSSKRYEFRSAAPERPREVLAAF